MTIAHTARMVSPFPYPSFAYIVGANSGKPNPARERKHETAARAGCGARVSLGMAIARR